MAVSQIPGLESFLPKYFEDIDPINSKILMCYTEFMSIDSESFAPLADHFGVSLRSYPKLPSHCLPVLMVSLPTPSRPTFHP